MGLPRKMHGWQSTLLYNEHTFFSYIAHCTVSSSLCCCTPALLTLLPINVHYVHEASAQQGGGSPWWQTAHNAPKRGP